MVAVRKLKFDKDWKSQAIKSERHSKPPRAKRSFQLEVIKSEDLPKLISINETAVILRMHRRTVEELRNDGKLLFLKQGGRFYTTAELIAEYLESCAIY